MATLSDTDSHQIECLNLETEGDSLCNMASKSLSAQVVFGTQSLRPSASLDSLATFYDSHWRSRHRTNHNKVNPNQNPAGERPPFLSGKFTWPLPPVRGEDAGSRHVSPELLQSKSRET